MIALLPPEEVLLLTIKLPLIKKNQLIQAIPFAIQEELSEKVTHYRFTILDEQEPTGEVHLALIEKNHMKHWHQLLSEHQMQAHYFIPTLLTVPFQTNCINIMKHETMCLVRSGEYSGFVTQTENLNALLELHLKEMAEIEKHEKIIVRCYDPDPVNTRIPFDKNLDIAVEVQSLPESQYFTDLAQNALNNLRYNLLWGKLQARSKNQKIKRYWQITLSCLIAIILIAFINKIIQYNVYSSQNSALLAQIATVYKQNFPDSTEMVAPKLRLEEKLNALNSIAADNPYLNLLGTAGQVLKNTSILKINTVQFSNNTVSLEVSTQNFTELNDVITRLKETGLQVTQINAHSQDNSVSTTVLIKGST